LPESDQGDRRPGHIRPVFGNLFHPFEGLL
jgi:hypothetical protein